MRGPSGRYVHPMRNSTSLYDIRDVPAAARAKVGKAKWKISLKTANWTKALKLARPYADEHDRITPPSNLLQVCCQRRIGRTLAR
jgi:hypothetical protein